MARESICGDAYGSPEAMKYQDMPDTWPGVSDCLGQVAGVVEA
jgi:hypothetical protein